MLKSKDGIKQNRIIFLGKTYDNFYKKKKMNKYVCMTTNTTNNLIELEPKMNK